MYTNTCKTLSQTLNNIMENCSSKSSDFSYDVFLGYFNGGTSNAFVDRLHKALLAKEISTFRDGETRPAIEEIEKSRVPILVLCESYASSPACLDEVAKIAEYVDNKAKQVTVIFYKVEPTVIRKQKDSYAEAMNEHEKREGDDSRKKVQTWREALKRVCDLSGIHFKDNMDESELIEKIVKDTFTKLAPVPFPIPHVVGCDVHFERVMSVLDIESKDTVGMLGIYGSGGIGKTTFAAYLYDNIRHKFEAATFLIHDRERTNRSIVEGLEDLQKALLSQMGEEAKTLVGSTLDRCNEIKLRLRKSRVLLVLDDVDKKVILKSLAGGCDWFGPGSRIIITTRDTAVLDNHDVEIKKYKLEELNDHDSLELFCLKAFGMSRPAEKFENMSSRAVSYAKGIPLALRVIGSNLKGRSIEEWEIELGKYRKVPDAEIQSVLEISYDSLSELDQRIFLDIACFFIGEKWTYVQRILEACDFSPSFRVFDSKCLISIDENGCVKMHDLIRDMGREIVRKKSPSNPGERSRLWSCEDILQVLKENSGGSKIEGIMLHPPIHEEIDHWTNTAFEKMINLRILIVRNATFSTGPSYLPNSLRLLDWMGFPSKSLPTDFHPERIVDFKLSHSSLIFAEPLKAFNDLTFMNLSQCQSITHIPRLSGAENLRVLTLDRCYKLKGFDKSFGLYMTNLVYLSASECTMLKSFVPTMYFPSLEVLSFNFCTSLESFPEVNHKMSKPLKIHLAKTAIKEFPKSIHKLTGLEYADMSTCEGLRYLSRSFLSLPKLVTLKVDGCSQLGKSFKKLKESLSMENACSNLKALYFSKANLSDEDLYILLEIFPKLEFLNVSHNAFLSLPEFIKGPLLLKRLDICYCRNLVEIPELPPSIQKVDAKYCQSLSSKASSVLWSQVFKETERTQVVMPKTEIPNWFDCVGSGDIPLFWARHKFPIVALTFVFHEIREDSSEIFPGIISADQSHNVGLHLFIEGHEICHKDYSVGENHVLVCELRALFNDEEWKDLDACLGDDWMAVQVQCESNLIMNRWGVYVYKGKTNTDDIRLSPFSTDNVPSSCLVPKETPEQQIRHIQGLDLVEIFGQNLNTLKLEQAASVANELLRWWRSAKADVSEEVSASTYGASLMQEHEQCVWDSAHILEMMENVAKHITDSKVQSAGQLVIQLLMERAQPMKDKGHETLHIYTSIPVILEECECHPCTDLAEVPRRRYWGSVELEEEDPLVWRIWKRKESFQERVSIVLSKCQHTSTEGASSSGHGGSLEDENKYPPALEELLTRIEEDAMRLNKSYGKLKASIVPIDVPVSDKYNLETAIIRGQERLGRLGSNFNKTPDGKLRVEHDDALGTIHMQPELRVEHDDALGTVHMQPELRVEHDDGTVHMQPELRVEHDAQNNSQSQKQHELGVKHDAQSQSTVQNRSKKGWTKILNWWNR